MSPKSFVFEPEWVNNTGDRIPKKILNDVLQELTFYLSKERENPKYSMKLKSKKLKPSAPLVLVTLSYSEMKKINRKYRKKDKATDVLSFESPEGWGELLFCPEIIAQQAKDHGLSLSQEWSYLLIHGVLHLLGFDHEKSKKEEKLMFNLQDSLFEKILFKKIRK